MRMIIFLVAAIFIAMVISYSIKSKPDWYFRSKEGDRKLKPEDRAVIFLWFFFQLML
jgi:hypothetical protein